MPLAEAHNEQENPHLPIIDSTKRQILENLALSFRSPTSKYILPLEILRSLFVFPSIPMFSLRLMQQLCLLKGISF